MGQFLSSPSVASCLVSRKGEGGVKCGRKKYFYHVFREVGVVLASFLPALARPVLPRHQHPQSLTVDAHLSAGSVCW